MIVYKDLPSLERTLGFPAKTLYGLSNNISAHYRKVSIPKSDGSHRVLSVPDPLLKKVQRAIAEILLAQVPIPAYAKAYRKGANIRQNAAPHVGKAKLLKLDIYHFFDSIQYSAVKEKVFPADTYAEPIRVLLSMLCYCGEALPQGAPTSPAISNIILRDFDGSVGAYCAARGIAYSRYCDDMTFSGEFDSAELSAFVARELKACGFLLNDKKTRVAKNGERKTVTGIVVNEKLNVKKEYRRELRRELYYCQKFGVADHLARTGDSRSPARYLQGLLGRVNYVLQITPADAEFLKYKDQLKELIKADKQ